MLDNTHAGSKLKFNFLPEKKEEYDPNGVNDQRRYFMGLSEPHPINPLNQVFRPTPPASQSQYGSWRPSKQPFSFLRWWQKPAVWKYFIPLFSLTQTTNLLDWTTDIGNESLGFITFMFCLANAIITPIIILFLLCPHG